MNGINHWNNERLVRIKQQEIEREIEQARLAREAQLYAGPSLLERILGAIRKLARSEAKGANRQQSGSGGSYRSVSDKLA
jgi:hypothetical protein